MKTRYKILKDGHGNFQVKYKIGWFMPWEFVTVGFFLAEREGDINYKRRWDSPRLFKWLEDAEAWVERDKEVNEKAMANYYIKKQNQKLEKKLKKVKEY